MLMVNNVNSAHLSRREIPSLHGRRKHQRFYKLPQYQEVYSSRVLWHYPCSSAIGAGLPITEPKGSMIVDIGSAFTGDRLESVEVKGRDLPTRTPKVLTIDSDEVREAISEQVNAIVGAVRTALEQMPPELSADLIDFGIMLAGGGALLKNLDFLLRSVTKLPIKIAADPLSAVAVGAGMALSNLAILRNL